MKKYLLVLALLVVTAGSSFAQFSFGGGAQTSMAFTSFQKPLDEYFGTGFGGGVHGDLNIVPEFATRFSFDYNTFSSDKTKMRGIVTVRDANGNLTNDYEVEGANVSIVAITANALGKIQTGSSVTPYGVLGFGLHILNMSNLQVISGGQQIGDFRMADGSTNFGLNFGAGVEFGLGRRTNLFVESKYMLIFASGGSSSYVPLTLGVSF